MSNHILGLHHITAIANDAQQNYTFYTKVLGLRLVKKTVNFDDPGSYHFYFGNETGAPGTILTFFPWEGIGQGHNGTGMATEIAFSVAEGSLDFWKKRLAQYKVQQEALVERFGETGLSFSDPDGLRLTLVIPQEEDNRKPWITKEIGEEVAIRGFHHVTLNLKDLTLTARVLTKILGYEQVAREGQRYRFKTEAAPTASFMDIQLDEKGKNGHNAAGTVHHIAFCVKNEETQMAVREKIMAAGLRPTPKIDRDYFYSVYFREPGGVLFEIATQNPGFTIDEPLEALGSHLMLPAQYEPARKRIEDVLPKVETV